MGNTSSSTENILDLYYNKLIGKHIIKVGGDHSQPSAMGGYASLGEYGNSLYSQAKEQLIRGIAEDVADSLKINSKFAKTAPINEIIKKLKEKIPHPSKDQLSNDSSVHRYVCEKLARSINKRYDMDIIDTSATPGNICKKVMELMYSLFTGLHSEFLTVATDIQRTIKNLQVLKQYVDSANTKLMNDLAAANMDAQNSEAEMIKSLYEKLTTEIDRQLTILANLTSGVIGPVGKSLSMVIEENDDFAGLSSDLEKMLGTPVFSEKLSYLLSGTTDVAYSAQLIDKALKDVGLTVKDYKDVRGLKELKEKVYNSIIGKASNSKELYKMLAAADILYRHDMSHDDIIKYLENKKGGVSTNFETSYADGADIATSMDTESPFKGRVQSARKSISSQLKQKEVYRRHIFSALNSQIKDQYEKIKYTLSVLSKKIGSDVEITPELDMFIKQLNNFDKSQPDRQNIHIALSGFRKDMASNFVKHQFMESLMAISDTANELVTGKAGELFKDVKSTIDRLLFIIEEFNDKFTKSLSDIPVSIKHTKRNSITGGGTHLSEIYVNSDMDIPSNIITNVEGGCDCTGGTSEHQCGGVSLDEEVVFNNEDSSSDEESPESPESDEEKVGGAPDTYEKVLAGVTMTFPSSEFYHFKTLKRVIRETDYYYRIAGIKKNMVKTANEFETSAENYENILGEEAGFIIDQIQIKYDNLISALESGTDPASKLDNEKLYAHNYNTESDDLLRRKLRDDIKALNLSDADAEKFKEYIQGYKFLLEYIRSSKIEMLEAAQALDLYLSKFTKSVQLNPDQIKEFVQILEQIEIVAKWFTDKSGDNLALVFEKFPIKELPVVDTTTSSPLTEIKKMNIEDPNITDFGDKHYYEFIKEKGFKVGRYDVPYLMTKEQAVNFVKQIEKSVKGVRALENIIATFTRVNVSVPGEVKTFMSSGLMFKAFMKYCVASAISVGVLKFAYDITDSSKPVNNVTPSSDVYASIYSKMAVGLRHCNDRFESGIFKSFVELCDPLKIADNKLVMKNANATDKIFELSIKSMIAKIFTVVGSYTLFNKPSYDKTNPLSLPTNPLRQILGGNATEGGYPITKIHAEAAELYIRLPLLVEWYRKVFEFDSTSSESNFDSPQTQGRNPIISMIPDIDSIWGDLCKVIFIDAIGIDDGAYPADYVYKIIDAINGIYLHYKNKNMSNRDIIMEFVLEVNRRYGFVMRDEINKYIDERHKYLGVEESYPQDDRVDYDILNSEDQLGRNPAPSDKFRSYTRGSSQRTHTIEDFFTAVRRFRESIEANLILKQSEVFKDPEDPNDADNSLSESQFRTVADVSLTGTVRQVMRKLENASTDAEKYHIIHEQLHGVEKFGDIDQQKVIMFHETVITPLTILYFVYTILNDYNKFFVSVNIPSDFNAPYTIENLIKHIKSKFKGKESIYKQNIMESVVHLSADELRTYFMNNNSIDNFVKADATLDEVLRKIMNIGCDLNGLTDIYFVNSGKDGSYPVISFDKLEEVCFDLFEQTKKSFHQLRKYLPYSLIKRMEDVNIKDTKNKISLFYIQEHLIDRLFKNKYGNGLSESSIGIKNIWKIILTDDKNNADKGITLSTIQKLIYWDSKWVGDRNKFPEEIDLSKGNMYENTQFPNGYIPIFKSGGCINNPITKEERNIYSVKDQKDHINTKYYKDNKVNVGYSGIYRYRDDLINADGLALGLVCKLNNLIFKYFRLFIDVSSGKIYRPLIERFVNGHNSKDILQNNNIDDIKPDFKLEPGKVLFDSLASAIKTLMTAQPVSKIVGTAPVFIEDNFANVSQFQKELMRAYLPVFDKELNLIVKKADFLRRCLEETNLSDLPSSNDKSFYISSLDDIGMTAKSLLLCVDIVSRELNDMPMFFETYNNSIVDYNNRNGHLPFMPLSQVTHLMNFGNLLIKDDKTSDDDLIVGGVSAEMQQKIDALQAEFNKKYTIIRDPILTGVDIKERRRDLSSKLFNSSTPAPLGPTALTASPSTSTSTLSTDSGTSTTSYVTASTGSPTLPVSSAPLVSDRVPLRDRALSDPITVADKSFALSALATTTTYSPKYDIPLIPRINSTLGGGAFKFTYGTRGLLHYKQKPSIEFAPGVSALLNAYNNKLGGASGFEEKLMADLTKNSILLARWVTDFMYHKQILDKIDWEYIRKLVGSDVFNLSCQTSRSVSPADYSFFGKTSNVAFLSENDNFKQSVHRLISSIVSSENKLYGLERSKFRIFNILDLNIVPINIHAMQREIPFVNILNYAYTFDNFVKNFVGVQYKGQTTRDITNTSDSDLLVYPEDFIVKTLMYPLGYRSTKDYLNNVYKIMAGNTSLSLNKPKYLSDQLWNKVLLNSLYLSRYNSLPLDNLNEARRVSTALNVRSTTFPISNGDIDEDKHNLKGLSFIRNNKVESIEFLATEDLRNIGYDRYNTNLVRWLEMFVQSQRIVRLFMRNQLEWVQDPVVHGTVSISEDVTEYKNNNVFKLEDFE